MQTRRQSLIETGTSFTLGLMVNWLIAYLSMSLITDRGIAATVTVVLCSVHSLVRGYGIRRWFARREGA